MWMDLTGHVMKRLTLGEVVAGSEEKLGIRFVSGIGGLAREIGEPAVCCHEFTGIGAPNFFFALESKALVDSGRCPPMDDRVLLMKLRERRASFIALADTGSPPPDWIAFSEEHAVVLCVSRHDPHLLKSRLIGLVREKWEGVQMVHASLVSVNGKGILLTGEAGSGKTRLALALAEMGHAWVADDTVVLKKGVSAMITGRAHVATSGLIHWRGRGIMPVQECIPDVSIKEATEIHLIAELTEPEEGGKGAGEVVWSVRTLLGIAVWHVRLSRPEPTEDIAAMLLRIIHNSPGGGRR